MKKDVRRLTAKARRENEKGDEMETEDVKKMNAPKKILIINGPNFNMLGIRESPTSTGGDPREARWPARQLVPGGGRRADYFQSNHEGAIVDRIQEAYFEGSTGS